MEVEEDEEFKDAGIARHQMSLFQSLLQLKKDKTFVDIDVKVGNEEFSCHKFILAASSPYFLKLFSDDSCNHITLDISELAFQIILVFIYTGLAAIHASNVQEVEKAASELGIQDVLDLCSEYKKKFQASKQPEKIEIKEEVDLFDDNISIKTEPSSELAPQTDKPTAETNEKEDYICNICSMSYSRSDDLEIHYNEAHGTNGTNVNVVDASNNEPTTLKPGDTVEILNRPPDSSLPENNTVQNGSTAKQANILIQKFNITRPNEVGLPVTAHIVSQKEVLLKLQIGSAVVKNPETGVTTTYFRCPLCSSVFSSKNAILQHFKEKYLTGITSSLSGALKNLTQTAGSIPSISVNSSEKSSAEATVNVIEKPAHGKSEALSEEAADIVIESCQSLSNSKSASAKNNSTSDTVTTTLPSDNSDDTQSKATSEKADHSYAFSKTGTESTDSDFKMQLRPRKKNIKFDDEDEDDYMDDFDDSNDEMYEPEKNTALEDKSSDNSPSATLENNANEDGGDSDGDKNYAHVVVKKESETSPDNIELNKKPQMFLGYICCSCNKFFEAKTVFVVHFECYHPKKRSFKIIRYIFLTESEIEKNANKPLEDKECGFVCSICQHYEDTESLIKRHALFVHGKTAKYRAVLYKVIIKHETEEPFDMDYLNNLEGQDLFTAHFPDISLGYLCRICSQFHELKKNFISHVDHSHPRQNHFELMKYQMIVKGDLMQEIDQNTGFFCKICCFFEASEKEMKTHMVFSHKKPDDYNVILYIIMFDHETESIINDQYLDYLEKKAANPVVDQSILMAKENESLLENSNKKASLTTEKSVPGGKDVSAENGGKVVIVNEEKISESVKEFDHYKCDDCGDDFLSFKDLKLHLFEEEHTLHCSICKDYKAISLKLLYNHNKNVHGITLSGKLAQHLSKCPYCSYIDDSLIKLRKHISDKHLSGKRGSQEKMQGDSSPNSDIASPLQYKKKRLYTDDASEDFEIPDKRRKSTDSHSDSSSDEPNVCKLCGKFLSSFNNLKRHVENVHGRTFSSHSEFLDYFKTLPKYTSSVPETEDMKCYVCSKKFNTKELLTNHLITLHKACEICKVVFKTKNDLDNHHKNKHLNCDQCDYQGTSLVDIENHYKTSHANDKKSFICSACNFITLTSDKMNEHMKVVHNQLKQNSPIKLIFENDESNWLKQFRCLECKETFKSANMLNTHLKKFKHGQRCIICGFQSTSVLKFHCHNADKHQIPLADEWKKLAFKCSHCQFYAHKLSALTSHVDVNHPIKIIPTPKTTTASSLSKATTETDTDDVSKHDQKCIVCGWTCIGYKQLLNHRRETDHKLACSNCDYKTLDEDYFIIHNINKHQMPCPPELKDHINMCSYCSYATLKSALMKKHMKSCHSDVKRTDSFASKNKNSDGSIENDNCDEIEKISKKLDSNNENSDEESITKTQKSSPSDTNYTCNVCNVNFSKRFSLVHHRRQAKHFLRCDNCQYEAPTDHSFYVHINNKHKVRLSEYARSFVVPCPHCDLVYPFNADVAMHVSKYHKDKMKIDSQKNSTSKNQPSVKNVFFTCNVCKLVYSNSAVLYRHRESCNHLLRCKHCTYTTIDDSLFSVHLHNYHNIALTPQLQSLVFRCSQCSHVEADFISLLNHVSKWHKEVCAMNITHKWSCDLCDYLCYEIPTIGRHYFRSHDLVATIGCTYCSYIYISYDSHSVLKHLQDYHKDNIKNYKSNMFSTLVIDKHPKAAIKSEKENELPESGLQVCNQNSADIMNENRNEKIQIVKSVKLEKIKEEKLENNLSQNEEMEGIIPNKNVDVINLESDLLKNNLSQNLQNNKHIKKELPSETEMATNIVNEESDENTIPKLEMQLSETLPALEIGVDSESTPPKLKSVYSQDSLSKNLISAIAASDEPSSLSLIKQESVEKNTDIPDIKEDLPKPGSKKNFQASETINMLPFISCLMCEFKSCSYHELKIHCNQNHKDLLNTRSKIKEILPSTTLVNPSEETRDYENTSNLKRSDLTGSLVSQITPSQLIKNPNVYICSDCNYQTSVIINITKHMKQNHNKSFNSSNFIPKVVLNKIPKLFEHLFRD